MIIQGSMTGHEKVALHFRRLVSPGHRRDTERDLDEAIERIVVPRMKSMAPARSRRQAGHSPPGTLRARIDARPIRRRLGEYAAVGVGPKMGRRGHRAWWAHFVTGGTRRHTITARSGVLQFRMGSKVVAARSVVHPGSRPNPFVTRAAQGSERAVAVYLERLIVRRMELK